MADDFFKSALWKELTSDLGWLKRQSLAGYFRVYNTEMSRILGQGNHLDLHRHGEEGAAYAHKIKHCWRARISADDVARQAVENMLEEATKEDVDFFESSLWEELTSELDSHRRKSLKGYFRRFNEAVSRKSGQSGVIDLHLLGDDGVGLAYGIRDCWERRIKSNDAPMQLGERARLAGRQLRKEDFL